MNKEAFDILEKVAASSFSEPYAGLHTMLRTNEQFAKYVERNYRVKKFNQEHDFFLTRNELYFHHIGFMDAILWLSRSNMLKHSGDRLVGEEEYDDDDAIEYTEEGLKLLEKSALQEKAIWNFITCYETGEDWPFNEDD